MDNKIYRAEYCEEDGQFHLSLFNSEMGFFASTGNTLFNTFAFVINEEVERVLEFSRTISEINDRRVEEENLEPLTYEQVSSEWMKFILG